MAERTTGMVLGKFMPPHLGHRYLIDFARNYVDDVTVLVCSLPTEPIEGTLRYDWMRRMFPDCDVVHVTEIVPQEPSEHPDFWDIWRELVRRYVPREISHVFASEAYGARLAAELGAEYVPVDAARELMPVSGTDVRRDPMGYWRYIPPEVRPYFVRRVCIFGPESTGKSTLARDLANHFDTLYVHEYARPLLEPKGGQCEYADISRIARGQVAAEEGLARHANRLLFCDTDPLTTTIWSDVLFGEVPAEVEELADARDYDLYLVCDVDVPWVDDDQRYFPDPEARREFLERCIATLEERGRRHQLVSGSWKERFRTAVEAVEGVLRSGDV